jgi:hypothetical protein
MSNRTGSDRPTLEALLDVELDIDAASRDEVVEALISVGCSRHAAEALAARLKGDAGTDV